MTIAPLLVTLEGSGPPKIIDLTVTCPAVNVTTGPPTPPTGVGAGLGILLGIGLLAIVMTSKK